MKTLRDNQSGYILIGVLALVGLGIVISAGMLDTAKATAKTRAIVKTRSSYYYDVERTLNSAVVWLQDNSKNLTGGMVKADFEAAYDLSTPAIADNEGTHFQTPTMVKVKGTNDAPMVSNNAFFGTSNFPNTKHIDTNVPFNPVASFNAANIGPANARIVMVWARENADSYEPVFRIDVLTGNNPDRGVHSFSYVYSQMVTGGIIPGFFGKSFFETGSPNNECNSYKWEHNGTNWNPGSPRSNCVVGSDGTVTLKSKINGSASSLQDNGVVLNPPGGQADNYCENSSCHNLTLPDPGDWASNCPGGGPNVTINSNTTYSTGACYDTILIKNGKTLSLTDTSTPYYIKTLNYQGNNANLDFGTIPPDEKVTIYVEKIDGDHINGNRVVNGNNAPHQVELYYIGTDSIKLNGTAEMNMVVIAPYAHIDIQGNFIMNGGVLAQSLKVTGAATINFVENIGTPEALSDMTFSLRKASQRYR